MTVKITVTPLDLTRRPYQNTPAGGRCYDFGPADEAGLSEAFEYDANFWPDGDHPR